MKERIAISEWKVMEVLWQEPNILAAQVVHALTYTGWSDKTIKTLLSRLVKKGLIDYAKEGKSYRYYPLVNREDCIQQESKEFINKIFGGSGKEFMASFLKSENLSKDDIEELKNILNKKGN